MVAWYLAELRLPTDESHCIRNQGRKVPLVGGGNVRYLSRVLSRILSLGGGGGAFHQSPPSMVWGALYIRFQGGPSNSYVH